MEMIQPRARFFCAPCCRELALKCFACRGLRGLSPGNEPLGGGGGGGGGIATDRGGGGGGGGHNGGGGGDSGGICDDMSGGLQDRTPRSFVELHAEEHSLKRGRFGEMDCCG